MEVACASSVTSTSVQSVTLECSAPQHFAGKSSSLQANGLAGVAQGFFPRPRLRPSSCRVVSTARSKSEFGRLASSLRPASR